MERSNIVHRNILQCSTLAHAFQGAEDSAYFQSSIVAGIAMQLNLFNALNSFCELNTETNRLFTRLNHNLAMNILESQAASLGAILSAGSSILAQPQSPAQHLKLVGSLRNELLESSHESLSTTMAHLHQARPMYEQLAIASAGAFGDMLRQMTKSDGA